MKQNTWEPCAWYCSNCGTLVTGYKNAEGMIKVECKKCGTVLVRKTKGRRHDTIEMYAPKVAG
jgi:ribosomal protein S27E